MRSTCARTAEIAGRLTLRKQGANAVLFQANRPNAAPQRGAVVHLLQGITGGSNQRFGFGVERHCVDIAGGELFVQLRHGGKRLPVLEGGVGGEVGVRLFGGREDAAKSRPRPKAIHRDLATSDTSIGLTYGRAVN